MTVSGNRITMSGKLTTVSYEAQLMVQNEGGSLSAGSDRITISNATAVTILLAGGTNYDPAVANYIGSSVHTTITNQINNASGKTYDQLKSNHLNDEQRKQAVIRQLAKMLINGNRRR